MVLKVYHFQKPAFSLTVRGVNWLSIDTIVAVAKQKQTKWCLKSKILF